MNDAYTGTLWLIKIVFCGLVLVGCVAPTPTTPAPDSTETATLPPAPPEPAPEPIIRPFPTDTLYDLLVAEFAARRGLYEVAMDKYSVQAEVTRDPEVVARAARIARFMGNQDSSLNNAVLWAEISPEHPEAQFSAATELGKAGRPDEAFPYMRRLEELGGETNYAALAAGALELRPSLRRQMLESLEALPAAQSSDNINDRDMARAILLQGLDRNEEALERVQAVLAKSPDHPQAGLVEMQIYRNMGREDRALERLQAAVEAAPENKRLRLQLARMLARTDMAQAREQFEILAAQAPDDGEIRLSLALVYRELDDINGMRRELETLIDQGQQLNAAHLYLGQEAENAGDTEAAIEHYLAMAPSQYFTAAVVRAGRLLLEQDGVEPLQAAYDELRVKHPDEALQLTLLQSQLLVETDRLDAALELLNAALDLQPDHEELLYARSLIHERRGDINAVERDLRRIIDRDPDNATALNALGYTLTNLTDRHLEAVSLIERALEIKPEDPAILDSLGWAYFRLGRLDAAEEMLARAYAQFPDPEVAAHLGEVLWMLEREDEARRIWQEAMDNEPDNRQVPATLERLGVRLSDADDGH